MLTLGVIYTIPSLAFLAFLIPSLHLGKRPAIVVLAAYAQLALVRNIAAALRGVDPATIEAATGSGMTCGRSSAGAAAAGPAGPDRRPADRRRHDHRPGHDHRLDQRRRAGLALFDGISRDYPSEILAGTVAIVALSLAIDFLLRLSRAADPRRPRPALDHVERSDVTSGQRCGNVGASTRQQEATS